MQTPIKGICSMATRALLEELVSDWSAQHGTPVSFEADGGVDVARRVASGERFDVVALASDAIGQLAAAGRVDGRAKVDLVRSGVGMAVPSGDVVPRIVTEDDVRQAVLAARRIALSTGPSGVALAALFERWAITREMAGRLLQAPPGTPVAALVARKEASLGFQQMSELIGVEGIAVVGPLPGAIQIATVFSAAPGVGIACTDAVGALLRHLISDETADAKRRHGMEPA